MKYIILNIKSLFKNERMFFLILFICIFLSSFVLNFSYGLYQNYNIKKYEENSKSQSLVIDIKNPVKKSEFKEYIESLSEKTLSSFSSIFIAGTLDELESDSYNTLDCRFIYKDGVYSTPDILIENLESQKDIKYGRYFTADEEKLGSKVAFVSTKASGQWNDQSECLKVDEKHIKINGETYEVVGGGILPAPTIPFMSVPDDFLYDDIFMIELKNVLSNSAYNEMKENAQIYLEDSFVFPELDLPDTDSISIYKNIIAIAVLMCLISALNFILIYRFILEQRKKRTAIFRINGCTRKKTFIYSYLECVFISVPVYILGTCIFNFIFEPLFENWFEYFDRAYTLKSYFILFIVYAVILTVMVMLTVSKNLEKSIVQEWKE